MTKKIKTLAIIPARGGSKGIPNKNIKIFNGKPLLYYTITEAKKSGLFDRIILSTDSSNIAEIGRKYGVEVPFLRPSDLAQDSSNIIDIIIHLLDRLKKEEKYVPEVIFLLQPTSPLRDCKDIVNSYHFFNKIKASSLVSVCKTHHEVWQIVNNKLKIANLAPAKVVNRQERPDSYRQDGSMIYIIKTKVFLQTKDLMPEGTVAFVIPKWKAVDIDDPEDFELAEVLYKNKKYFKSR